jgi:hypothetical protein
MSGLRVPLALTGERAKGVASDLEKCLKTAAFVILSNVKDLNLL